MTLSAYGYVAGNPLNGSDPNGLNWLSNAASSVGKFIVKHRGAIANVVAGAVCVGTAGTGCLVAVGVAAGINAEQTAQNGGSIGAVAFSVVKSAAFAVPGLAEYEEEETAGEALSMMARYGISTEGWEAPAWLTYGSRFFYEGAVATPDLRELYRSLSETSTNNVAAAASCG
jgi:hypothetical protein